MAVKFSNNFATTLAGSITSTATTLPLTTVSGLPTLGVGDYTYLTLETGGLAPTIEIVKVTAINSGANEVTVVRAQDGTTASSFTSGDKVELRVSAILLNDLSDEASVTLWADVQNKPDPTLTLTGDVTGTVTFTDLGNGSMATTASADLLRVDGDGSDLTDVRAETIEVNVKNVSGGSLAKGTPVHQTGTSGSATFEVVAADASNASVMPAHFVLLETLADQAEGRGLLMGRISGVDTSSFNEGDTIYVAVGGGYTNSAPTGEGNLIQNLGTVTRVDATNGGGEVMGAGRSNATPNLNNGNIFLGNASNQAATASLSTSVQNLSHYNSANWDTAYGWGDHATAGYQAASTALTTSTTFGGDVSGTYNAIVVANDSHTHDGRYYTETEADTRFVNVTGDTLTGRLSFAESGYSISNDLHVWKRSYSVWLNNPKELLYHDGNSLPNGGAYRFHAHIAGTGTDQSATAVYWNENGTWKVNVTYQSGVNSNHPEFIIGSNGKPHISIDHSSTYTIEVLGERLELGEGTGTDNKSGFGADAYMSEVLGALRHNPNGGSDYTSGNRVFTDGYHPNADKWTTARTLTLDGDVSGSVSWDGSANATLTTTIADDSHNHVISNVDGLQTALDSKYESGDDISVGNITATGYLRGPATFTIDPSAHGDNTGTVVIAGNLQVDGTTTTINSTTLTVDDKNIVLADGAANAAAADGAGITIDGADASILWDATNDIFDFSHSIAFDGTATTTNQGRGIFWTGYDKEGVTDYTDAASIRHTTNTGGHAGSVLVITSQNDTNDGIAFVTHTSSPLKHNGYQIWTAQDFSNNSSNWNTAYTYSQVGHLPLAGGTMTGTLKAPTVGVGSPLSGDFPESTAMLDVATTTAQTDFSSNALTYGSDRAQLILDSRRSATKDTLLGYAAPMLDFRASDATNQWSVAQIIGTVDPENGTGYQGGLVFATSGGGSSDISGRRDRGAAPTARVLIGAGGNVNILTGDLKFGTTPVTVIDSSRNISNVGTISSGAITSSGTGTFEGGGNTLTLKKGTGTPAIAFAGTASDPQTTALIEGISGGGLKIYTSSGTVSAPSWSPKITLAANGDTTFAGTISSGAISSQGNSNFGESGSGTYKLNIHTTGNSDPLSFYATSTAEATDQCAIRWHADNNLKAHVGLAVDAGRLISSASANDFAIKSWGNIRLGNSNGDNTFTFTSTGNFQVSGTTVIDSSRNLTNIGTITSSGSITSSAGLLTNNRQNYASNTSGWLLELGVASNNYAHIHGTIKLQQFNFNTQQIVNFSATVLNTGAVQSKAATSDIDITLKLFVYNSKWYVHVPAPSTFTDISAYVHMGAGYQGTSFGESCLDGLTNSAVPSSGVTGSVDIVAKKRAFEDDNVTFGTISSGAITSSGTVSASGGNSGQWNTAYTYSQVGHLPLAGGTMSGNLLFSDSGTTKRGIQGQVGTNDYWFIGGGATAANAGFLEIAAGDDGSTAGSYEPIYVRQYLGTPLTGTVQRTLTLLDNNGNTSIPNALQIGGTTSIAASSDTAVALRLQRSSASGRSQMTFEDESGSQLWRVGLTASGGDDFTFYDGAQNVLILDRDTNAATFHGGVSAGSDITVGNDVSLARSDQSPAFIIENYNGFRLVANRQNDAKTSTVGVNASGVFYTNTGFAVNTTTVIDSSRNLVNVGTISSGAITSSGAISGTQLQVSTGGTGFGKILGPDGNHQIILRGTRDSTSTGADMTTYYQYGGTLAAGKGHLFYTGGPLSSQTLKLGIHDDAINFHQPFYMGGTQVMDTSRNMTSIGTISSGAITSNGNLTVKGTQGFNALGETASIYLGDTASEIRATYNGGTSFYLNAVHRMEIEGSTGNLNLITGNLKVNSTTVIDASRNITGQSVLVNNGLTVRNGNTNAAINVASADNFCGIGWNRNVSTGAIYDSDINAFQMHIQNNTLEIETYNGSGSNVTDNAWTLDTSGNMSVAGVSNAVSGYQVNGTTVIDSSRNLTNIASLSIGAQLYSSNTIQANGQYALVVQNSSRNDNQTYYDTIFVRNNNYSSSSLQGQKAQIGFATVDGDGDHHRAQIVAKRDTSGGNAGGRLEFLTRTSGASPAVALTLRHDKSAEFAGTISSGAITTSGDLTLSGAGKRLYISGGSSPGWSAPAIWREGTQIAISDYSGVALGGYDGTAYGARLTVSGPGDVNVVQGALKIGGTTVIDSSRRLSPTGIQMSVDTGLYATNATLSYYSSSNGVYLNGAGGTGWLRLNAAGTENDTNAINIFGSNAGANITFKTAGTQRMNIDSSGNLRWGSANTAILDPSRNLTNIGTVSSTHFTSSANINSTGVGGITVSAGRLGFDQPGTRSWTMGAAAGDLNIYTGDGNGALNLTNNLDLKFNSGIIQNYDSADCGIVHPRENLDGVPLEAGLAYYAFNHNTSTHPATESEFDTMERTNITSFRQAGTFTNASAFTLSTDGYLVEFHGYLLVTTAGDYRFGVSADDAVDLYIDGVRVADDYGGHGATGFFNDGSRTSIYLSVGYHKLFARFEEVSGGDECQLGWNGGSGTTLSAIPAANLYRGRDDNFKNYGGTTYGVGNLTMTGNVTAYSDEKLKSDIQTLDGSKVLEMRGVSFTKDGVAGSGVIAQELEKVAPELVHDGEYKSVAYGNLVGYLIEAVKMQQEQINELKALIKEKDNGDH